MSSEHLETKSDFDQPILFRTTNADVYKSSLDTGSIWMRSDEYYCAIEDKARQDAVEGVSVAATEVPMMIAGDDGSKISVMARSEIHHPLPPHYIVSFHGGSISADQRKSFGGCTFGIRNFARLVTEVAFHFESQLRPASVFGGQIQYQYGALVKSHEPGLGFNPWRVGDSPPTFVRQMVPVLLRKIPVLPFIEQDEWRIVAVTGRYLNDDPTVPIKLNVAADLFYPCGVMP